MHSQDFPIRHFELMTEIAVALKALRAQVRRHEYSYEGFGSWCLEFRHRGSDFRLTFDGREREIALAYLVAGTPPYAWSDVWRRPGDELDPISIAAAVRESLDAG